MPALRIISLKRKHYLGVTIVKFALVITIAKGVKWQAYESGVVRSQEPQASNQQRRKPTARSQEPSGIRHKVSGTSWQPTTRSHQLPVGNQRPGAAGSQQLRQSVAADSQQQPAVSSSRSFTSRSCGNLTNDPHCCTGKPRPQQGLPRPPRGLVPSSRTRSGSP